MIIALINMIGEMCMTDQKSLICQRIDRIINEINNYIDYLYITEDINTRNMILGQLRGKIQELHFIGNIMCTDDFKTNIPQNAVNKAPIGIPQNITDLSDITIEELAQYNGMNGNPAYVAVDGTVYDVTNAKNWKNGQHQSCTVAGVDLTSSMPKSPHGNSVLNGLPVVGTLTK
jgi:predicted heme/steroid binding protein